VPGHQVDDREQGPCAEGEHDHRQRVSPTPQRRQAEQTVTSTDTGHQTMSSRSSCLQARPASPAASSTQSRHDPFRGIRSAGLGPQGSQFVADHRSSLGSCWRHASALQDETRTGRRTEEIRSSQADPVATTRRRGSSSTARPRVADDVLEDPMLWQTLSRLGGQRRAAPRGA
jgi:hypothetical protein